MDSKTFEWLWAKRLELLPNTNEDARQHAFTELLAENPSGKFAEKLEGFVSEWHKRRTNVVGNEVSLGLDPREVLDAPEDEMGYFHPYTVEDAELASVLDEVLRTVTWDDAQSYILLHLRGADAVEAADYLGLDADDVRTRAEGVNGLVKASLVKSL